MIAALALVVAACGSGKPIMSAGNRPTTVPTSPSTTVVGPTSTAPAPGSTSPTDSTTPSTGTGSVPDTTAAPTTPPSTLAPSTTTTTPLADLPPCPVDALESADGTVTITFWHGMTSTLEQALIALTDEYNSTQSRVRVRLENQGGYEQVLDKYLLSGTGDRPHLVQGVEYGMQTLRDTESFVPVQACMEASGFDAETILGAARNAYSTEGVQWAMPFNMSVPVLYYNRALVTAAGLDPDQPPRSLEELEQYSRQIVESGAAPFGLVVDTNFDSGGGWFVEQWFAKAGEFYADNENGRSAPATRVLFDGPAGVELLTFLQNLLATGGGFNVGDNTSSQDNFLKLADTNEPGAMTIGTSAALGTVLAAVQGGIAPNVKVEDIGVSFMPGPNGSPNVVVGGASLWITADKGDAEAAAAWDYVQFLVSAESQAEWAAATGYVPVHLAAPETEPLRTTYASDPRFRVAYDSVLQTPADEPTAVGPLLGPQREIRGLTSLALAIVLNGGDPANALADAAAQANALLADYNARR